MLMCRERRIGRGIGVILVAGGAAPLAADWLDENSWFKVLPDPQFAHVLGLVA
ncbi:MAG: hypothetical protein HC924_18250 [Synechococcaceae cyanobacterium SM2_3_2]|nr:hypothetical protein [Synechococcaceae cyanobacterium SM2_3_2]